MKREIKRADEMIMRWQTICDQYPLSEGYKKILFDLQQYRTDLVNKIGRKEKLPDG